MGSAQLFDDSYKLARREESKAHNEMDYYERIAKGQQTQMDALLVHKDECVEGIARAKKTGLPPMHVREFELLMAHIDLTVETLSYKVEKSLSDFKKAKDIWVQKNKIFNEMKEKIKEAALIQAEETTDPDVDEKDTANTDNYLYGHRGNNAASKR